MNTLYNATKIM